MADDSACALVSGGGGEDLTVRWRGIEKEAVADGQVFPSAFPVVTGSGGGGQWVALDWKILKEAKAAVA